MKKVCMKKNKLTSNELWEKLSLFKVYGKLEDSTKVIKKPMMVDTKVPHLTSPVTA